MAGIPFPSKAVIRIGKKCLRFTDFNAFGRRGIKVMNAIRILALATCI